MTKAVLDHIGLWCRNIDRAACVLARDWGLTSEPGGRHPGEGTHNRLIGALAKSYIELIGPDPDQEARGTIYHLGETLDDLSPCLAAFRHPDLDQAASAAEAVGLSTKGPRSMSRKAADGSMLTWRVLFFKDEQQPFFPFLIDWGGSPHPSASLEPVAKVADIGWETPYPAELNRKLRAIGIAALAVRGESSRLRLAIETPKGRLATGE